MKKRVVVITGASSGIGRETALRFARNGDHVVLVSRRGDALEALAAECASLGSDALVVVADVTKNKQVVGIADAALDRFGRIDVWVNNASVGVFGSLLEVPVSDFRRVLDVNIMGYVLGARAAMAVFKQQRSGVLVNVSSILAEVPLPYLVSYSMSKAATSALSTALRQELAVSRSGNVAVTSVLPSTIDTPFYANAGNYQGRSVVPPPPLYPPRPVAKAIFRAASHPKREYVVGRAGRQLKRLHKIAPNLVDKQMAALGATTRAAGEKNAPLTPSTVFEASTSSQTLSTGGWDGARKLARRRAVTLATVATGVIVISKATRKAR